MTETRTAYATYATHGPYFFPATEADPADILPDAMVDGFSLLATVKALRADLDAALKRCAELEQRVKGQRESLEGYRALVAELSQPKEPRQKWERPDLDEYQEGTLRTPLCALKDVHYRRLNLLALVSREEWQLAAHIGPNGANHDPLKNDLRYLWLHGLVWRKLPQPEATCGSHARYLYMRSDVGTLYLEKGK